MYMNVLALQVHWEVYGLDILCCLWSFYFAKLTSGIKNPRTANAPSFLSLSHLEECPTADKSSSGDVIRVLMNGRNRLKSNICFISSGASSLCTPAFSPRVKSFSSASSVTKGKNKTKEVIPAVVICGGWSANWVSSVVLRWETPPWRSNSFPPYESHLEVVYLFIYLRLTSLVHERPSCFRSASWCWSNPIKVWIVQSTGKHVRHPQTHKDPPPHTRTHPHTLTPLPPLNNKQSACRLTEFSFTELQLATGTETALISATVI